MILTEALRIEPKKLDWCFYLNRAIAGALQEYLGNSHHGAGRCLMRVISRLRRGNGRHCEIWFRPWTVSRSVSNLLQYRVKIASSYREDILHHLYPPRSKITSRRDLKRGDDLGTMTMYLAGSHENFGQPLMTLKQRVAVH